MKTQSFAIRRYIMPELTHVGKNAFRSFPELQTVDDLIELATFQDRKVIKTEWLQALV
jgi:hypothetical protein